MTDHSSYEPEADELDFFNGPDDTERQCGPFALNPDNYHSSLANAAYMSNSQFNSWMSCAARTYAEQAGTEPEPPENIFIGGQFAHTEILEPARLPQWMKDNPGVKKPIEWTHADLKDMAVGAGIDLTGAKSSKDKTIERLEENNFKIPRPKLRFATAFKWAPRALSGFVRQPAFMDRIRRGRPEVIVTFKLGNVWWKAKIDNLRIDDQEFDDIKFMANFESGWIREDGKRRPVDWEKAHNYPQQMAVYQFGILQQEGVLCAPNLLGSSKEDPPDVDWIKYTYQEELDALVAGVAERLPEVMDWKLGKVEAPRCGQCGYCRRTKILTEPYEPRPM